MNTNEADKVFHRTEQTAADRLTEYEREEKRRFENFERLKRERLEREAAAAK
jgi:hypothetical protein